MANEFTLRLAETIAWCLPRAIPERAGETTRTLEWKPSFCGFEGYERIRRILGSPETGREAVDLIVEKRREALLRTPHPLPPLGELLGGRVFATDFNTDLCGAATAPSNGFLDDDDTPGWDTWFAEEDHPRHGNVIYGWVPPALLSLASDGFWVIPFECIWWVNDEELRRLMSS
ncbi:hypothetical protein LZ198_35205 [Myxococcus sp. K15C18031901]|uniref:hypothetical protein n=1 Tax=Myxococcus dinghuensis TaxID=2906761 RepID=UPI0020A6ECA3|nr:hypothetical protein [Myxococcus dinghuensis]MCP3104131.1 hypothetical protein [Myxococcus dinghuensis]